MLLPYCYSSTTISETTPFPISEVAAAPPPFTTTMFRQASRVLARSINQQPKVMVRAFSTDVPATPTVDSTFIESWKKVIPNMEPPKTPSTFMQPRPPTPSTIPSKLTVNFVLPYASELSKKEVWFDFWTFWVFSSRFFLDLGIIVFIWRKIFVSSDQKFSNIDFFFLVFCSFDWRSKIRGTKWGNINGNWFDWILDFLRVPSFWNICSVSLVEFVLISSFHFSAWCVFF